MSDSTYKMDKRTKALLAVGTPEEVSYFKRIMVEAEFSGRTKERFTMNYDVKPNGTKSKPTSTKRK